MCKTALYRFYGDDDALLYVGMSQCPYRRAKTHGGAGWYFDVRYMEVEWLDSRADAHTAERIAIDRERPRHNRSLTHRPRRLAVTPRPLPKPVPEPKVKRVYYGMGPHLPPMQGPRRGYGYSVGLPDFKPDGVPPNRMFDCDLASVRRAIKVCRAGDTLHIDPRVAVSDVDLDGAIKEGIYIASPRPMSSSGPARLWASRSTAHG